MRRENYLGEAYTLRNLYYKRRSRGHSPTFICSEALLKRGMISAATAVAQQIEGDTSRSNMLARIASTPTPIPQAPAPASPAPPPRESEMQPASAEPTPLFGGNVDSSSGSQSPSIPLADAVEVISEIEKWPRYPYMQNSFMTSPRTHVWIDEPGLMIRLKPLDFDGAENLSVEYVPDQSWGVCLFHYSGDLGKSPMDIPPGRYRVLVQDLDYGWDLDRRGTLVIGQGQQTIHLKRSFVGQHTTPVPKGANFRWAGKTYRMKNAAEMNAVNQMLAAIAGGETEASRFGVNFADVDFTGHPLAEQLTQPQPGPERKLKSAPRSMKLEIPAGLNIWRVEISTSDLSHISWTQSSPMEFHLPPGPLTYEIFYKSGFAWPGNGSQYKLVPESLPNQTLVAQGLTKAAMRRIIDANRKESGQYGSYLGWFEEKSISLPKHAVKAAERLMLAWLDGQPEVPEAELLQIGGVETWEMLWANGQSGQPEKLMTIVLQPGSAPGTWRLKEPPEGAVAP